MNVPRTIGKLVASSVSATILSLLAVTFFAQAVGAASLGIFFLFQSVLSVLTSIGDFGVSVGVEKRISSGNSIRESLGAGLIIKVSTALFIAVGLIIFRPQINDYLGISAVGAIIVAFVSQQVFLVLQGVIRGDQRVGQTAVFQVLKQGTWLVLGSAALQFGYGVVGLIYAYVVAHLTVMSAALLIVQVLPSVPTPRRIRELIDYSLWSYVGSLGGVVYNWMDVLLIGYFMTNAAVGAYEVAWMVTTASLIFSRAVRKVAFPIMNAEGGREDISRLEELVTQYLTPSLYFVIPAFVGATILGDEILTIVFGPEFSVGWVVLSILMVEKIQRAISYVLISPMHAVDRPDLAAKSTAAGMVANLSFNIFLIPRYGLVGAALATMLAETVNFSLHLHWLRHYMRIHVPVRELLICTMAAVGMGGVLFSIKILFNVDKSLALIAIVGLSALLYVFLTAVSRTIREQMLSVVQDI
ncbi:MATE family membrane protein, Rfbx family [Halorhabdus sp. SVX81]|uniref:flippase n=1 Tax=Halorhabdus sp. SVX81 TaxID=2978283 RepID=UPI0023DB90F4|nr:flippase [Halorhabdus sp. SVX81]WEL16722.1 MATE family membrane protein, Rfbx family [Halorhabdus sp. SVX81]